MTAPEYILGLDYGTKRMGVAIAHNIARLPRPLMTLQVTDNLMEDIRHLVEVEKVSLIVVGIPRNMDGSESAQSQACEAFARELSSHLTVRVKTADETLTSEEAEQALKTIGKPYKKQDIDAMSAALILERFFEEQGDSYGI